MTFHLTCDHIIFSSVSVAEWPPFLELAAYSVDLMFSFVFRLFVTLLNLVISRFGLEGWIWFLIASFPDLCILSTLWNVSF